MKYAAKRARAKMPSAIFWVIRDERKKFAVDSDLFFKYARTKRNSLAAPRSFTVVFTPGYRNCKFFPRDWNPFRFLVEIKVYLGLILH